MPITHNLGRINKCQIVGTKDRFIEVRCEEAPCVTNCFECVNGACVAQVGGQFNTAALCNATSLTNTCTGTNAVLFTNNQTLFFDWYFANHPTQPISNYFFEFDGPCPSGGGPIAHTMTGINIGVAPGPQPYWVYQFDVMSASHQADLYVDGYTEDMTATPGTLCANVGSPGSHTDCMGPNGGLYRRLSNIKVYDGTSYIYDSTSINDLITALQGFGCAACVAGMTYAQLKSAWIAVKGSLAALTPLEVGNICCGVNSYNCCYGPNGGYYVKYDNISIQNLTAGSQFGPTFTTYTALVAWAVGQGCTNVTVGMTYSQLVTELALCLCNGIPLVAGNCTAMGMIDSGLLNTPVYSYYDWLIAQGYFNIDFDTYYFEHTQPPNLAWGECESKNGLRYMRMPAVHVRENNVTVHIATTTGIDPLIAWLNANVGPGFVNTMGINDLTTHLQTYWNVSTGHPVGIQNKVYVSAGICNCSNYGCQIIIDGTQVPCECSGCGNPPKVSWECYDGAAGSYCADPGDGSGTYMTEADCLVALAAGSNNSCNINGPVAAPARVNGATGTVFTDYNEVVTYYTTPANGISGIDAMTLFFEMLDGTVPGSSCSSTPPLTECCEGPSSTVAVPTLSVFIKHLQFNMPYESPTGVMTQCCVPDNASPYVGVAWVPFLTAQADYESWYGNDGFGNLQSWSWDEVLQDAMAAGITGIDMTTPWDWGSSTSAPSFNYFVKQWQYTDPAAMAFCETNSCEVLYTNVQTALADCKAMYNYLASNNPNFAYGDYYYEDISCTAGASCATANGCYRRLTRIEVIAANGTVVYNNTAGATDLITWLNANGGTLSVNIGMTYTQLQTAINTVGNFKGGRLTCYTEDCTCTPITWDYLPCGSTTHSAPVMCKRGVHSCISMEACMCTQACANITYNCSALTGTCTDPGDGTGFYSGPNALADCINACNPIKASWNCVNGTCSDPGDGTGTYATMALCLANGGADTCSSKTDIGFQTGSMAVIYNWFVSSAFYSTNFQDYKYETLMAGNSAGTSCLGPNNKAIYAMNYVTLIVKGVSINTALNVNDLITLIQSQGGTSAVNTMTVSQLGNVVSSEIDPTAQLGFGSSPCHCSKCGGTSLYDCVPGAGCGVVSGGQYTSLIDCQAANVWVNSCDGLDRVGSPGSALNLIAGDMDQLREFITLQSNLYTSVDVQTLYTYLDSSWEQNNCLPASTDPCSLITENGNPQVTFGPYILWDGNTGATLPGFAASYVKWDLFLAAAVAIPATNITATTQFADAKALLITWGNSLGKKAVIQLDYICCACTDGCPPATPRSKACLVLWLDAEKNSIDVEQPPALGGVQKIEKWYNKAYDGTALPIDLTAYYTWDTIAGGGGVSTKPTFNTTAWAFSSVNFTSKNSPQYLIANPNGPNAPRLQPDTGDATHSHGWSLFFHRNCTSDEWINSKTWFMGDDWSAEGSPTMNKASGIKPSGQPYCDSNYYMHNHSNKTTVNNDFDSSPLNETLNTGFRTLQGGLWYLHWIIAEEQKPYGNDLFNVTWGIGNIPQFKDTIKGVDLDMVIANINTRNRAKDGFQPGNGFFSEIRGYNCAFDQIQLSDELEDFEIKYGTLNIPSGLPLPCGNAFVSTALDGVDGTHISINDNDNIGPSVSGFTAAFWIKFNSCPEGELSKDACLFEKGMNGPVDNEKVSFRLFMSDDPGNEGNLYWDVFGDRPEAYAGNYSRQRSSIAWLGDGTCNNMVGKWHHIAVTTSGPAGRDKKIYIDGKDYTGVGSDQITGNIIRRNYPLNLGDSSRVDYTTSGNYGPFITWNTELSAEAISQIGGGSNYFDPFSNVHEYQGKDFVSFYSKMDAGKDLSIMNSKIVNIGGVTVDTTDIDPVNAGLPTDIKGLDIWLKAGTRMLADQDSANNNISRADYMVGDNLQVGDKITIWECHANTGKYCAQIIQSYKPKYESDGTAPIGKLGVYTDSTDRLQIFNTNADGGINLAATNGSDIGAFTIMWRVVLESNLISESFMGDTSNNSIRMNSTTQIRVKLGGGSNKNFNLPAGSVFSNMTEYIFTLDRNSNGVLNCHVNGGTFNDLLLSGSGTLIETAAATIDHIIGIPGVGMQGWFFDLCVWKSIVLSTPIRKAMYRSMLSEVNSKI